MTDTPASSERPVIVLGGESGLLCDLVGGHLAELEGLQIEERRGPSPARFRDAVRDGPSMRPVGILLDPVGEEWGRSVDEIRSENPRVGIVVLTARPDYSKQRYWRRYLRDDVPRANALLAFASETADLADAIDSAWKRPGSASQFWLDGPKHPFAYGQTTEGRIAAEVRSKPLLHEALLLEARGVSRKKAADRLEIRRDQVGERLAKLRGMMHVFNNVQMGHVATRMGLLDDVGELNDH